MTKEEKRIIEKYEKNIITAGKYNYVSMMPRYVLEKLQEIYNAELGTNVKENFSCGTCVLNFLKKFYLKIYSKM